ncbi:hypothetical protein PRK78_006170 [Emydomyces testavorans]|uniref:Protein kinase domain-containing protein n=1 Tax=Emydomyces testavorans TaxID=2070801 RepID=A0AAF0DM15_9EURO|nr:hypothetical protein PRK78_006170 [Emydomyces testavorans]
MDLRKYLAQNKPFKSLRLKWFCEMTRTLAHIHDQYAIVADIASHNFFLAADLSVKFCDFTDSSVMDLHVDMETAGDDEYSIQTDVGQLGAVIYEVVSGERCEFDLFKEPPPAAILSKAVASLGGCSMGAPAPEA